MTASNWGHFRPYSLADFYAYAKNLAWLIEEPLHKAQDLLARMYGYSSLHELQQVMKQPGKSGFEFPDRAYLAGTTSFLRPEIGTRQLILVAEAKGLETIGVLPKRYWEVREIALYGTAREHREAFRLVKGPLQVSEGVDDAGGPPGLHDYAVLEGNEHKFTVLGRSVFVAASQLVEADDLRTGSDIENAARSLDQLSARHPNNPWVSAMKVIGLADRAYLSRWADHLDSTPEKGFALDADPAFKANEARNAKWLLPAATKSIAQFGELLGSRSISQSRQEYGSSDGLVDTYFEVLFWGSRIAAAAGEDKLALQWGRMYRKTDRVDRGGIRYVLAPLYLNLGLKGVAALFGKDAGGMGDFVRSIEAATKRDWREAGRLFASSATSGYAVFECFTGRWAEARQGRSIGSNLDQPAMYQEFMYRTEPFWAAQPAIKRFFTMVAADEGFREEALKMYARLRQAWGNVPFGQIADRERERKELCDIGWRMGRAYGSM